MRLDYGGVTVLLIVCIETISIIFKMFLLTCSAILIQLRNNVHSEQHGM